MSRKVFVTVFYSLIYSLIILLSPANCFASISGTVTDTVGSPVSGAFVTFTDESNTDIKYSDHTDNDGKYELLISPVLVEDKTLTGFRLKQNYPNPFNPTTTIPYSLEKPGHVILSIYNIMGQKIRTLIDNHQSAGSHDVTWNSRDDDGKGVAAVGAITLTNVGRPIATASGLTAVTTT